MNVTRNQMIYGGAGVGIVALAFGIYKAVRGPKDPVEAARNELVNASKAEHAANEKAHAARAKTNAAAKKLEAVQASVKDIEEARAFIKKHEEAQAAAQPVRADVVQPAPGDAAAQATPITG